MGRVREERSPTGGGTSDCDLWFWRKSDRGHVDIPITGIEKKDCHSSFSVVIFLLKHYFESMPHTCSRENRQRGFRTGGVIVFSSGRGEIS